MNTAFFARGATGLMVDSLGTSLQPLPLLWTRGWRSGRRSTGRPLALISSRSRSSVVGVCLSACLRWLPNRPSLLTMARNTCSICSYAPQTEPTSTSA